MKVYQYSWVLILFLVACTNQVEVEDPSLSTTYESLYDEDELFEDEENNSKLDFDTILLERLKQPYSIVDYFLLLPEVRWFDIDLTTTEKEGWLADYQHDKKTSYIKKLDKKNHYMEFGLIGDINLDNIRNLEGLSDVENISVKDGIELTFWVKKNKNILLCINSTSGLDTYSEAALVFYEFTGKKWIESDIQLPTFKVKDVFKDFEYLKNEESIFRNYLYQLPQKKGGNILIQVNPDAKEIASSPLNFSQFELVWKEEQFVIENKK